MVCSMTSHWSEPAVSRRARSFLRRWQTGSFRRIAEALPLARDGGISLFDTEGNLLACWRDAAPCEASPRSLDIGTPAVARLVGDLDASDPVASDAVQSLVLEVADADAEMDELSRHALERHRELSLLYDFSEKAGTLTSLSEIMNAALKKAVSVVKASGASLLVLHPDASRFRVITSVGTVPEIPPSAVDPIVSSGKTWVGMTGHSLHEVSGDAWLGTLACVPLRSPNRVSGVLVVLAGPGRELRPEDQRLLTALASLAAMRLDLAQSIEADARKRELTVLGHVATAIAHDFKNPLTAIRGFAEMIQMPEIPPDEHGQLADQIIHAADRLWRMAEEILDFARGNVATLQIEPVSGDALSVRLRAALEGTIPNRIKLDVDLRELGEIRVDPGKVERAIVNLVRNACEAINGAGCIKVRGSRTDDHATIVVEDDGPGIPSSIKASLFDPFVTAGKPGGTGLGLAIVKKIIEDHRGSAGVQSRPGAGTVFTLTLPGAVSSSRSSAWRNES